MEKYDEVLWFAGEVQASGAEVTPEAVARRRRQASELGASVVESTGESLAIEDEERTVRKLLDELVEYEGLLERMEFRIRSDDGSPPAVKAVYLFTERGAEQLRSLPPPDRGEAS